MEQNQSNKSNIIQFPTNVKEMTVSQKRKLFLQEYTEICKKYDLMFDCASLDGMQAGQMYFGSNPSDYVDTEKPYCFEEVALGNGDTVIDLVGEYHPI